MVEVRREKMGESTLRGVIWGAIGMGVVVFIFASLPPRFFSPSNSNIIQAADNWCESRETVDMLKKQVRELNEKLEVADQGKNHTQKAGPFGTVKSKTNPTVAPDETVNPRLANMLSKIAVKNELIVALANSNVKPMLEIWFASIKKVGISNYLVVALDDVIVDLCKSNDVPFYKRDPDESVDSPGRSTVGSVVSALKFRILREFLQLGYNVLLSDTDVIFTQNPFDHLCRDSDVESMSDGHDKPSAYGYNHVWDDPTNGWSRFVYTTRIWAFNSGFFYIRATVPSIELLDRVTESLKQRPGAWDQAVYNEELFHPSSPGYVGLTAQKRAMDIFLFMNSNVLFKTVRKDANLRKQRPVVVHVNYHPDKLPRMKAVFDFYFNAKEDALQPFPDGTQV